MNILAEMSIDNFLELHRESLASQERLRKTVVISSTIVAGLLLVIAAILLWMATHCCAMCNVPVQPQKAAAVVTPPSASPVIQEQQPKPQPKPKPVVAVHKAPPPAKSVQQPKPASAPVVVAQAAPPPAALPAPAPKPVPAAPPPQPAPTPVAQTPPPAPQQAPAPVPAPAPAAPAPQPAPAPAPQPAPVVVAQAAPPAAPARVFTPPATQPEQPPKTPVITEVPPLITVPPPKMVVASAWTDFLASPIEKGNFADYSHVDVGVVLATFGKFQFEPYVALNAVKDTKGYQWDNRIEGEAGVKIVRPVSIGLFEFGAAYADEYRASAKGLPSQNRSGGKFYSDGWFGWEQPTARPSERHLFPGSLPGTFQYSLGNISPYEKNNLIGSVRIDQGITLAKFGHVSLIPSGWLLATGDTDKNPWNNRYTYGGGLKIAFPWSKGMASIQGGYECAEQYRGVQSAGSSACGPAFHVNLWTGGRKKIGGE